MSSCVAYRLYPNKYSYTLELCIAQNITTLDQAVQFRALVDAAMADVNQRFPPPGKQGLITLDLTELPTIWYLNYKILAHLAETLKERTGALLARFDACVYIAPSVYKYPAQLLLKLFNLSEKNFVYGFGPSEKKFFTDQIVRLEQGRPTHAPP